MPVREHPGRRPVHGADRVALRAGRDTRPTAKDTDLPDAAVGAVGVAAVVGAVGVSGAVGAVGVAATAWVALALGVICAAASFNPPWLLVLTATATTTATSAPNAMSPVGTLCRAGQDLRFCPFGVCGGMADCCGHDGGWGASC